MSSRRGRNCLLRSKKGILVTRLSGSIRRWRLLCNPKRSPSSGFRLERFQRVEVLFQVARRKYWPCCPAPKQTGVEPAAYVEYVEYGRRRLSARTKTENIMRKLAF